MIIAIGSDHGGLKLKTEIVNHLKERGFEVSDKGCNSFDSCDYPDYSAAVTDAVVGKEADLGILVCGTGIGMSMAANKVHGIRAALCGDCFSAQATKEHNNANVLCLGERVTGPGLALKIVDIFVDTPFSNEDRHIRRIDKFDK